MKERKAPSLTLAQGVSPSPLPAMDKEGTTGTTSFFLSQASSLLHLTREPGHIQTRVITVSMAHNKLFSREMHLDFLTWNETLP